jgi:hypothetical protein
MWPLIVFLAFASLSVYFAADDDWAKVKALASGTELRIVKTGTRAPILAKLDQATEESLIIATKTEQLSIPKEQLEKIEYRPKQGTSRAVRENRTDNNPVDKEAGRPSQGPTRTRGPSGSSSSNVTLGGKPDFQVVWTRPRRN